MERWAGNGTVLDANVRRPKPRSILQRWHLPEKKPLPPRGVILYSSSASALDRRLQFGLAMLAALKGIRLSSLLAKDSDSIGPCLSEKL
jgi:hypothetical protein